MPVSTELELEYDMSNLNREVKVLVPSKKKKKDKRELFELIKKYGIKAPETYDCIRLFYESQLRKYLLVDFDESLLTECHIRVMRAIDGYYKEERGKKVWVPPYYDPDKCKDPINFIITICKYTAWGYNYHYGKRALELDRNERLDDLTCNSILDDFEYFKLSLKNIKFENSFSEHLKDIIRCSPSNNVLLNLIKWDLANV